MGLDLSKIPPPTKPPVKSMIGTFWKDPNGHAYVYFYTVPDGGPGFHGAAPTWVPVKVLQVAALDWAEHHEGALA